ncbi:MAG: hypothetical protein ACRD5D_07715 [Candidatus Polarisedimenticolia bacterium]
MPTATTEQAFLLTFFTYGLEPLLAEPAAALLFCRTLQLLRQRHGIRVRAFVVLPDRARLILAAADTDPRWVILAAHRLKSRFAREWNARAGRLGRVWQDADQRLPLAGDEDVRRRADLLHRSPVLAGLAPHPGAWRFSSWRAWNGGGRSAASVDLPDAPPAPPRGSPAATTG